MPLSILQGQPLPSHCIEVPYDKQVQTHSDNAKGFGRVAGRGSKVTQHLPLSRQAFRVQQSVPVSQLER